MSKLLPSTPVVGGSPAEGPRIADVEKYNRDQIDLVKNGKRFIQDIFNRPNVGELKDWYSDARFAQQHFTGTNPTTIEWASCSWIRHFIRAATTKEDADAKETIAKLADKDSKSLYVQDYSYFRKAAGIKDPEAEIKRSGGWLRRNGDRWGCAAVCLFFLDAKGMLYPLAIVPDWRGSLEASVTIYNRELFKRMNLLTGKPKPAKSGEDRVDEAKDWPWRYGTFFSQIPSWGAIC